MNRPDLDAIEARCEAATPGPWQPCTGATGTGCMCGQVSSLTADVVVHTPALEHDFMESATPQADVKPNAAFIAAVRQDVPALVAYCRQLEQERDALRAIVDDVLAATPVHHPALGAYISEYEQLAAIGQWEIGQIVRRALAERRRVEVAK